MTEILACVDGSPYAGSVCDHAAWLSGPTRAAVRILHASEGASGSHSDRLTRAAEARLRDHGVISVHRQVTTDPLSVALRTVASDLLVLGKRGKRGAEDRSDLGSNAAAALRTQTGPLCLVSRVYLPVQRALVLIDADPRHRRTVETVCQQKVLTDLELDIVMLQPDGVDGSQKLAWARRCLGGGRADVYPMKSGMPETIAARYLAERGTDLIVFSREMMFDPLRAAPETPEHQAVWAWRVPVFVC